MSRLSVNMKPPQLLFVLVAITGVLSLPPTPPREEERGPNCGYQSCHPTKDGFINVHIVPHTHDDVGWLKTVDQYYYGSRSTIQKAGVQYILDSVIDELKQNPDRRFIYVETAFLWQWWKKQHDVVKHQFKKYIQNGQLEIIGGAWSMNDEAVTHYHSIIDQFTWGLRRLNDTFGKCGRPKIGWQIDPFGHSREMASIFAQLGYDGLLLGRIDYQDKQFRFQSKTPEMIWQGSQNLGNQSQLFTSVMYNTYSPPAGFCFDILCSDDPIIDDKRSSEYNVDKKVQDFFDYVANMTKTYTTSNVIVTMGEDFNYQDAHAWFKNLDKLILYANQLQTNGSKYNLIYSTPSCYLKAVHDEAQKLKLNFQVKTDDFFPYASDPHAYWTGYFTSRPTIKRYERLGNNFLQVCKQLYALTDLGPEDWADLNALREAMGVMQHHDAITGTEKQHVANDYARILSHGFDECEFTAATALSKIVTNNRKKLDQSQDPAPEIPFKSCHLTNVSQCNVTENLNNFIVTLYNPLSRPVDHYVRLPVLGENYKVTDPDGKSLPVQTIPIPEPIKKIPGRQSNASIEIVFLASAIPPLGFKSYYVEKTTAKTTTPTPPKDKDNSFTIDDKTGLVTAVTMNGKTIPLMQNFFYYRGAVGNNAVSANRSSGAYIFRPNGTEAHLIADKADFKIFGGQVMSEVHQTFNEWVSQVIKIYPTENLVEFEWLVGPLPVDDVNGKEVISRFTTNLKSESTFYTDSNGREILKRIRNFRPTWKLNITEPVSSNYYPVTSKILIRDPNQDVEVAVLTDRAQGGSSLRDGEIELMVHRNCLHDDAFGVDESLMEKAFDKGLVARGSHYLVVGPYINGSSGGTLAAKERDLAQRKLLAAWTFLSPTNSLTYEQYKAKYVMQYSGLKRALPDNVQILTLEPWIGMNFLLRLEHVLEKDEDPILSKPATVDLKGLFAPFEILSLRETTLGANQWLDENERLQFQPGSALEDLVTNYSTRQLENSEGVLPFDFAEDPLWQEGVKMWRRSQHDSNDINNSYYQATTASESDGHQPIEDEKLGGFSIRLNPMQIRTFVIDVKMTDAVNRSR